MRTLIIGALALLALAMGSVEAQQLAPPEPLAPSRMITVDSARAIALDRVLGNDGIRSGKLKKRRGVPEYEVNVEMPGAGYRQLRIDARTGTILADQYKDDFLGSIGTRIWKAKEKRAYRMDWSYDSLKIRKEALKSGVATVSEQKAREIALRVVPNGSITRINLDWDDGTLTWVIDVAAPGAGAQTRDRCTHGKLLAQRRKQ
jgi:uncharacterized membrane protein YkoI